MHKNDICIVLVGADGEKRINWLLGRIEEMYPERDGKERVAKVVTKNGVLVRPLQRLYLLECAINEESSNVYVSSPSTDPNNLHSDADERSDKGECFSKNPTQRTRYGRLVKVPKRF